MPTFEDFIESHPEMEELSTMEQRFEYDTYISSIMEQLD